MTTIKTSELTGAALDWAVAKCEGPIWWAAEEPRDGLFTDYERNFRYAPSTNWAQGGPIVERERIAVDFDADPVAGGPCAASRRDDTRYWVGPTPLIAAMRCFVASKLGDTVDIPEELQ